MPEITRLFLKTAFPAGCELRREVTEKNKDYLTIKYCFEINSKHDTNSVRMLEELNYVVIVDKKDLILTPNGARWIERTLRDFGGKHYEYPNRQ